MESGSESIVICGFENLCVSRGALAMHPFLELSNVHFGVVVNHCCVSWKKRIEGFEMMRNTIGGDYTLSSYHYDEHHCLSSR